MKKIILASVLGIGTLSLLGGAAVDAMTQDATVLMTSLSARQRYPWNGKVDIDFSFTCTIPEAFAFINFKATYKDKDGNTVEVPMKTFDQFTSAFCTNAGTYRVTWDSVADVPGLRVTNLQYTVTANMAKYMVVDLSKGATASPSDPYPVSYLEECPDPTRDDGGWTDEYKTTKMVFRLVQPSTWRMGTAVAWMGDWNDYGTQQTTLTRPYYLAIFEMTVGQLRQVIGSEPLPGFTGGRKDLRPFVGDHGSFDFWRGRKVDGYCWPNDGSKVNPESYIGLFRTRTGSDGYDFPTEAEWDCAAKAGMDTAWWWTDYSHNPDTDGGTGELGWVRNSELEKYARYKYNGGYVDNGDGTYSFPPYTSDESHGPAVVGSFKPNPWGFYDILGNAAEWVLDRKFAYTDRAVDPICGRVDPVPDQSVWFERVARGGSFENEASRCTTVSRWNVKDSNNGAACRMCWHFPHAAKTE